MPSISGVGKLGAGWKGDPIRHGLSAKGIKTGRKKKDKRKRSRKSKYVHITFKVDREKLHKALPSDKQLIGLSTATGATTGLIMGAPFGEKGMAVGAVGGALVGGIGTAKFLRGGKKKKK